MANLWQAPDDIRRQLESIKDDCHADLANASFWVLCSDSKAIKDNQLVATQTKKCTKTEKLSTGHDFKVVVMMETWTKLTDVQRKIALDEALCRAGVHRVPQTMEVNGRKEVVRDDLGRVVYTDEVDYDKNGVPRWKINPPDAGLYYALILRHGKYSEQADNITRVLANKPILQPFIAQRADVIDPDIVTRPGIADEVEV